MRKIYYVLFAASFLVANPENTTVNDSVPTMFQSGSKSIQFGLGEFFVPTRFKGASLSKKVFISSFKAIRQTFYLHNHTIYESGPIEEIENSEREKIGTEERLYSSISVSYSRKVLKYHPIDKNLYLFKGVGPLVVFSGFVNSNNQDYIPEIDGYPGSEDNYLSLLLGYGISFGFEYHYRKNVSIHLENEYSVRGGAKYRFRNRPYRTNTSRITQSFGPIISTANSVIFGISIYY